MLVTFSILCYNYGRYLAQAIDSCLSQSCPEFETEVLVIDDGSTDNTLAICQSYGTRIRLISEGNKGFGASLDRAIIHAHGTYVFLLDADDYFLPDKLNAFQPYLQNNYGLIVDRCFELHEGREALVESVIEGGNTSTICVRRELALDLIPVTNECAFGAIEFAGHGAKLRTAHTFYRYHTSSMTNRTIPGKWAQYLAGVNRHAARTMKRLEASPPLPHWLVSSQQVRAIEHHYLATADYNDLEAALETKRRKDSFIALFRMLLHRSRSPSGLSFFDIKMAVKCVLGRPSFPK